MDASSSSSSNSDNIVGTSILLSKRALFLASYRRNQLFSLPDSIMYYISKNPSTPNVYQKLAQACKYFFIKNSIIVSPYSDFKYVNNEWQIWINGKSVDLNNSLGKLCVIESLYIHSGNSDPVTIPKIYQSDAKFITLRGQKISFKEFIFLVSKCESITLERTSVINENGSTVALEKLVEVLPNVKEFTYDLHRGNASKIITSNAVSELLRIPHFSNIVNFTLTCVPEAFDIDQIFNYVKKQKKTKIYVFFCYQISREYKNRLHKIVKEILATKNRDYKPPFIRFSKMVEYDFHKLWILFDEN